MAICPECFQVIDRLDSMHIYYQPFHLDEQGQPVYGEQGSPDSQYFCPNCKTTVAMDEAGAIRILKGVPIKN